MADLHYNDVQRAVQDGLKQVQDDLRRLMNDMQRTAQQIQYTDETMHMVQDIQRMLQQHQPLIEATHRRLHEGNVEQRVSLMQNDLEELKHRFAIIERFAVQMGEYMRQQHDRDREDREYRSA